MLQTVGVVQAADQREDFSCVGQKVSPARGNCFHTVAHSSNYCVRIQLSEVDVRLTPLTVSNQDLLLLQIKIENTFLDRQWLEKKS